MKGKFCTENCGGTCKKRLSDGYCVYEYDPEMADPKFAWKGEGPPPKSWWVDGTKVYRTYADYCDD